MQTKMRLPYGDSVDLLGGTRITVLRPADRDPNYFVLRLQRVEYEEQLEGPAPEPLAEEAQQAADGKAPLADGGIGAPRPLPDASLHEGGVVEWVGSEPKPKRPLEIPGIGPESEVKILSAHTIVNLLMPGVTNSVSLELDLGGRTRISDRSGSSVPLSTPHYNFLTVLADTLRAFMRDTLQYEED